MKLGAYTISVEMEGQILDEHQVEAKGNEVSCWIASEEGKTFKVFIDQEPDWGTSDSGFRLFLDGDSNSIIGRSMRSTDSHTAMSGQPRTPTESSAFLFKSITTTDEETLDSSAVNESFGSIRLNVHRGSIGQQVGFPTPRSSSPGSAFNELAVKKKRVSHVCGLGEAIAQTTRYSSFHFQDALEAPLFSFVFKYRSRSLLQAMEIIPASPAPPPPPHNAAAGSSRLSRNSDVIDISSGDESDDDEAVRTLKAALAKAKSDARAAKALRRRSKNEPEDVKPKLERGEDDSVPRPSKKAKFESEVIELSD